MKKQDLMTIIFFFIFSLSMEFFSLKQLQHKNKEKFSNFEHQYFIEKKKNFKKIKKGGNFA